MSKMTRAQVDTAWHVRKLSTYTHASITTDAPSRALACAIQIGKTNEGEIPGLSSHYVELVFAPEDATKHTAEFYVVFSHPDVEPVSTQRPFTVEWGRFGELVVGI